MSRAIESHPVPSISPLAGRPAPKEMLVDVARLDREYFERRPDLSDPNQLVSFGTSGHRGSPLRGTFTEAHILAITQAICDYRRGCGTDGPLYMGKDTHAVSDPAQRTALEVLAANNVDTVIQRENGVTPTPVISWSILVYNRGRKQHLADTLDKIMLGDKIPREFVIAARGDDELDFVFLVERVQILHAKRAAFA